MTPHKPFPTDRQIRKRFRYALKSATPEQWLAGTRWYETAHLQVKALAARTGVSVPCAAGVVAAISPGLRWEINVYHAERILLAAQGRGQATLIDEGKHVPPKGVPTYSFANVSKAWDIALGYSPERILSGPKVTAFWALLATGGDSLSVCVDGHMGMLARGVRRQLRDLAGGVTRAQYRRIADGLRDVAAAAGLQPCQAQAVAWIVQKARETDDTRVPF